MRVSRPLIVGMSLFACIAGSPLTSVAADPVLQEIRFKQVSDTEEKVFFRLSGFYPPRLFGLKGENPRVVCDFFNARLGDAIDRLIDTKGALIQSIRVGVHESSEPKIRVVLDLIPDRDYDIRQDFFQEERVFVITVSPDTGRSNP